MQKKKSTKKLILNFGILYFLIVFFSFYGNKINSKYGFIARNLTSKSILSAEYNWENIDRKNCHLDNKFINFNKISEICKINFSKEHTKVLLVGDSHAWHYLPAFKEVSEKNKFNTKVITFGSCLYLPGMSQYQSENCQKYINKSLNLAKEIYSKGGIVVISNGWTGYIKNSPKILSILNNSNKFLKANNIINSKIDLNEGKKSGKLIIFGPSPRTNIETIKCMYPAVRITDFCLKSFDNKLEKSYSNKLEIPLLKYFKFFGFKNIKYLNVYDILCFKDPTRDNNDFCKAVDEKGNILFTDKNHLSVQHASSISSELEKSMF